MGVLCRPLFHLQCLGRHTGDQTHDFENLPTFGFWEETWTLNAVRYYVWHPGWKYMKERYTGLFWACWVAASIAVRQRPHPWGPALQFVVVVVAGQRHCVSKLTLKKAVFMLRKGHSFSSAMPFRLGILLNLRVELDWASGLLLWWLPPEYHRLQDIYRCFE